jgi:hypothetical protein
MSSEMKMNKKKKTTRDFGKTHAHITFPTELPHHLFADSSVFQFQQVEGASPAMVLVGAFLVKVFDNGLHLIWWDVKFCTFVVKNILSFFPSVHNILPI